MRPIFLLLTLALLASSPLQAGHTPPKIFLRVFIQTSGEGLPSSQATTIAIPPSGETIQIRTLPELTEQQLIGLDPLPSGGVRLHFNHSGQVNLGAITAQNQGRIMVIMIDGVIVYAPIIDEEIDTGELTIPHQINPKVVELLQDAVKDNIKESKR